MLLQEDIKILDKFEIDLCVTFLINVCKRQGMKETVLLLYVQ